MQRPIDDGFLDKTIAVWQPYSAEPLTREDARQIIANVGGFYDTLIKWGKEAQSKATPTGGNHASDAPVG